MPVGSSCSTPRRASGSRAPWLHHHHTHALTAALEAIVEQVFAYAVASSSSVRDQLEPNDAANLSLGVVVGPRRLRISLLSEIARAGLSRDTPW